VKQIKLLHILKAPTLIFVSKHKKLNLLSKGDQITNFLKSPKWPAWQSAQKFKFNMHQMKPELICLELMKKSCCCYLKKYIFLFSFCCD